MSDGARNFTVGLVSLGAVLGLATLLMLFGELDRVLRPRYAITLRTTDARGIRAGSTVAMNGVPIGVVHDVAVEADPELPVRIGMRVDEPIDVPSDARPRIETAIIGGSATLHLVPPRDGADPGAAALPKDGSAVLTGAPQTVLDDITRTIEEHVGPLAGSLEKFGELSETYQTLGANLNDLVRPLTEEQLAAGTEPNLRITVQRLNETLADARTTLGDARGWLGDDRLRGDVREIVERVSELVETAGATVDRYGELADTLEGRVTDLADRIGPAADELSATLEEVRRVTRLATEGDGTVAQLVNNPDLYRSLDDAAVRLERALVDFQLLLEEIRERGLQLDLW